MCNKLLPDCKYLSGKDIADSNYFMEKIWNTSIKDEEIFAMVDENYILLRPLCKDKCLSPWNRASYWYQGLDLPLEEILAFTEFGHC